MILMSSGKPRGVSAKALKAEVDALLAKTASAVKAKKAKPTAKAKPATKPAAKASVAAKPVAAKPAPAPKPKTRGGRLIEAEASVKAARPKDARLVWKGMSR
jgi:hypothetical protein